MKLPLDLYTASQVRELDYIAINNFGISGFTLMKRAAQATFDVFLMAYPEAKTLCVVCGSGNNGGDGYVIATLAIEAGFTVDLIQLGDIDSINGDALLAREAYLQVGEEESVESIESIESIKNVFASSSSSSIKPIPPLFSKLLDADIIVDAIFGTGLSRDISGHWKAVIDAINASKAKVVAVDIPSGLNADTGRIQGAAIKADLTVTYIGLKCGLFTGQARDYCGKINFDDLQVPKAVYKHLAEKLNKPPNKQLIPENYLQLILKPRLRSSHKGNHGHILFVGGAQGMSGAIRLAAEAGLRAGAGLVSIATDPSHANLINLTRPELMVTGIKQAQDLQPLIDKSSVIVIGPGLGKSDWAKQLLQKVLESAKPKVLDADALNLLSVLSKQSLHNHNFNSHNNHHDHNWILTPHPAEAARLLGVSTAEIEEDRYQSIQKLAKKGGDGYILKGAGTLVSDGNITHVCNAGNSGMASGGMGDVLSGVIAALIAQGLSLLDAATAGVQIHAQAADLAAQKGERGLLASDLFPFIRQLMNERVAHE